MVKKIDRRKIKSLNAIHAAFLELLTEVGFDEMTIKTIAEKSDISRKTFYLHYIDKYDLLDQIVDGHLKNLEEICEYKHTDNVYKGYIIWFEYIDEHKTFFSSLFKSKNSYSFRKKLFHFIIQRIEKNLEDPSIELKQTNKNIVFKFLGMAVVGVMESFVLDELTEDIETVATQVGQLVNKTLT